MSIISTNAKLMFPPYLESVKNKRERFYRLHSPQNIMQEQFYIMVVSAFENLHFKTKIFCTQEQIIYLMIQ